MQGSQYQTAGFLQDKDRGLQEKPTIMAKEEGDLHVEASFFFYNACCFLTAPGLLLNDLQ
jgi:hypothetical protein